MSKLLKVKVSDGKLLATAPNLEKMKELISQYYFGSTITLKPINDTTWAVFNLKGEISSVFVINKNGRFRFEQK